MSRGLRFKSSYRFLKHALAIYTEHWPPAHRIHSPVFFAEVCVIDIFVITIQIWWKFHFALTLNLTKWSLKTFATETIIVLLWHMQYHVAIWWWITELQWGEIFYDIKIQRYNESHRKIKISEIHTFVKFQRCPLKFHTKFWTHPLENIHFMRC